MLIQTCKRAYTCTSVWEKRKTERTKEKPNEVRSKLSKKETKKEG